MLKITFPNGRIENFEVEITPFQIAEKISKNLANKTTIALVNGEKKDIYLPLMEDCELQLITNDSGDENCLDTLRHDAAHILAQALKEIYKNDIQITIGPNVENGFYYDVAIDKPFNQEDLIEIEKKMHEIVKRDEKIVREEWSYAQAIEYFESIGERYKVEVIKNLHLHNSLSIYRQGDFIDLCRGPHASSTGMTKYFKLLKVSGAYWRGDSKNTMLQRIYGTAWHTKQALDDYLKMLEEAEKRDHRKLGQELDLFHVQEESPGSIFWHPNGWTVYRIVENYIRKEMQENGYVEVKTPQMVDKILWEKSGHWENFRENIFSCNTEDQIFAIKPMNCPCHIQIFNQHLHSYRDLPLRMAEFGCCHRNESSGSLHGIMRVRQFTQDDAHIFCSLDQVKSETTNFCKLLHKIYAKFGFDEVSIKLSTRPEKRLGTDEMWDKTEAMLSSALKDSAYDFEILSGEGAFYGPKLEFQLKDAIGRKWQCGTLQLDTMMPERLGAKFINEKGEKETPVMLHRAILGSLERFIGILIENHAGKLPLWLAPIQIAICTITNEFDDYAKEVFEKLKSAGIRVIIDNENATLNYKIRKHTLSKINYIGIIGGMEVKNKTISLRQLGSEKSEKMDVDCLIKTIFS